VDYHAFFLTNFNAVILQQILLVPLFNQVIVINRDHCFNCN